MNSVLPYALIPIIGLGAFCVWAKRQTDPLLVRRALILIAGGAVAILALVATIMISLARHIQGKVRPVELFAGWLFIATLFLLYAALRRGILAILTWWMKRAIPRDRDLSMTRQESKTPPVRCRWAELTSALVALILFLPYLFTAANCHRPKIGNARDPSAVGLEFERAILKTSDGVRLNGWFISSGKSVGPPHTRNATVLICHGVGVNSQDFLPIAKWLHDEGFQVMMFDLRGHGDSEGHVTSFGYYESRDVQAAVRYVQSRQDCDPKRIIGYAFSMGSASLAMSLRDGNPFCAVILDSPFASLATLQDKRFGVLGPLRPVMSRLVSFFCRIELGVRPEQISPETWIARVSPKPLLVIHGTADEVIPVSEGKSLFAAAGEPKSLWIVPGATHVEARNQRPEEYQRRVLEFINKSLRQSLRQ